jgi:hypothetical protein
MSAFPFFGATLGTAFFLRADGFFFAGMVFFAAAAFFTAAGFAARVIFFLVAITGFFLAAAARGAFFAALFFAFGTAFAMNIHHDGLSPYRMREKPHYWNIDGTPSYTLWMMQYGRQGSHEDPPLTVYNPTFNTRKRLH